MSTVPPIPIPAEFDDLALTEKRAYVRALRDRIEDSLDVDDDSVEDAIFEAIDWRREGSVAGTRRTLGRDELMGPLRAKYG